MAWRRKTGLFLFVALLLGAVGVARGQPAGVARSGHRPPLPDAAAQGHPLSRRLPGRRHRSGRRHRLGAAAPHPHRLHPSRRRRRPAPGHRRRGCRAARRVAPYRLRPGRPGGGLSPRGGPAQGARRRGRAGRSGHGGAQRRPGGGVDPSAPRRRTAGDAAPRPQPGGGCAGSGGCERARPAAGQAPGGGAGRPGAVLRLLAPDACRAEHGRRALGRPALGAGRRPHPP